MRVVFVLLILYLSVLGTRSDEVSFSPPSTETLRNMVLSGSNLLVGSNHWLRQLGPNLQVLRSVALPGSQPSRVLIGDPTGTYSGRIMSCYGGDCDLVQASNISQRVWRGSGVLLEGTYNAYGLFVIGPNGTSVFTVALRNEVQQSRVLRGNLVNVASSVGSQRFSLFARQDERDKFQPREFLAAFKAGRFSYYVSRVEQMSTSTEEIRVSRLCNNDTPSAISNPPQFSSYYEIELKCSGDSTQTPTAAAYIASPNPLGEDAIAVAVNRPGGLVSVCKYNISTINQLMFEKYSSCLRGMGLSGLKRINNRPCSEFTDQQLMNANLNECNLRGDLLPAQEVTDPLTSPSLLNKSSKSFSSLLHTTLDGFTFLFAGTEDGHLHQYYIQSSQSVSLVRSMSNISSSTGDNRNVTQLAVSNDGLSLYVLTSAKVILHSIDMCSSYKTCSKCVASGDPVCGWCTLKSICTRRNKCNVTVSEEWVTDRMGTCPVISSVSPSTIYTNQLQNPPGIWLTTTGIPNNGQSYMCSFQFQNTESMDPVTAPTTATGRAGDRFNCSIPPENNIPVIPEFQDSLNTFVSLRHNGVDVATFELFKITNCSVYSSCTQCINIASGCNWCPFTFQCIPEINKCGQTEKHVTGNCPKLLLNSTTTENYLIHTNTNYGENPLIIKAAELNEFSDQFSAGQFKCVICDSVTGEGCLEDERRQLFRLNATLADEGREVHCQLREFPYSGASQLKATLYVVWTEINRAIDNPDHAKVILYSCPRLGSNCAQCLSLPPSYQCSYCPFQGIHSCSFPVPSSVCMGPAITAVTSCDLPVITSFSPKSGPNAGGTSVTVQGTNLATKQSEIEYVKINGIFCNITNGTYVPGVSLTCETEAQSFSEGSHPIRIKLSYLEQSINSTEMFSFVIPYLDSIPATPSLGPVSGGTRVTIRGVHLNVGSNRSAMLANMECEILETSSSTLVCLSSSSPFTSGVGLVTVEIDKSKHSRSGFTYHPDPTFTSIHPKVSFFSGGTNYTITGTNLHVVQEPRLLFYYRNEEAESGRRRRQALIPDAVSESCWHGHINGVGITMTCMAPKIPSSSAPQEVRIGLRMDGVTALRNLSEVVMVHPNPEFAVFKDRSFSSSDTITLTVGSKSGEFVFNEDMVEVVIEPCKREKCPCVNIKFVSTNTSFSCVVEVVGSLPTSTDLAVMVRVGNYSQTVGKIQVNQSLNFVHILIPVVVTVSILFLIGIAVFAVVVSIFCHRARQKDHRYNELIMEMERLESSVARECKLGFAELQTDLDELTGDVSGYRLPYHNLQMYLLASLFPGAKDHSVLHEVQLPIQRQISSQRALRDFRDLCMDKKVLLILIRSMEEQRSFSIRDKSQVGSLLMVALHHRLDYATEILKTLLADVIHRAISRSHPKLLLRRTESVAERMLTNWLGFCLHGYITEHAGKPLYLLYRAVKSQLEKGPIDVITGEARYSLSEHKLIRQKMEVEVVNVTVESDDGLRMPVKLLDCDTVSQAKEKLLDAIYKATPISQRPALTSVDLEYLKSPRECLVLRDEDDGTDLEGDWKRINTLQHYCVEDGAVFRLMKRRSPPPPGRSFDYPASLISSHTVRHRALSEAEDGMRVWHLFKQSDAEDPRRSPFLNKKMITEVYLPRMLSTKNILQKFVDDLFNTLFRVGPPTSQSQTYMCIPQVPMDYVPGTNSVPIAVKYMLDFLDDMAESAQITDTDVVHTWKNNALALRFWVSMIKNPEFIFDINKSHTVDACLSVIAQAFIDGCSSADVKLTIDSPTSKLLYNKEVRGYKQRVRQYYDDVARLPRIPEDAMQGYLKQLSGYQTKIFEKNGGLVVESALYELLKYAHRFHDQFLAALRAAGLESRAQVFESVLRATM